MVTSMYSKSPSGSPRSPGRKRQPEPFVLAVAGGRGRSRLRAAAAGAAGTAILTSTVVLSFAATLGVSALCFNHVFGFGGADTSFPLYSFVFLVALGIDYNTFLMTRVREEANRRDTRHWPRSPRPAGVITLAGFVLAATFAVLATIPLTALTERPHPRRRLGDYLRGRTKLSYSP